MAALVVPRRRHRLGSLLATACAPRTAPPPPVSAPQAFPTSCFPPRRARSTRRRPSGNALAWQWLQAGDLRTAEREFTRDSEALSRSSRRRESGLGYVLLARRQPDDALKRFSAALKPRAVVRAGAGRPCTGAAGARTRCRGPGQPRSRRRRGPVARSGPRIEVLRFRGAEDRIAAARAGRGAGAAGRGSRRLRAGDRAVARERIPASASSPPSRSARAALPRRLEHLRKAVALDASDAEGPGACSGMCCWRERLRRRRHAPTPPRRRSTPRRRSRPSSSRAPGTGRRSRGCPRSIHAIAGLPEVTRGDVAAVLGVRLADLLTRRGAAGRARDRRADALGGHLDSGCGARGRDGAAAEPHVPAAAAGAPRRSRADRQPGAGAHRGAAAGVRGASGSRRACRRGRVAEPPDVPGRVAGGRSRRPAARGTARSRRRDRSRAPSCSLRSTVSRRSPAPPASAGAVTRP